MFYKQKEGNNEIFLKYPITITLKLNASFVVCNLSEGHSEHIFDFKGCDMQNRIDEVRLDLINWDQILQLECVHAIQLICTYFGQYQHDEPENVKMHNTHHNY